MRWHKSNAIQTRTPVIGEPSQRPAFTVLDLGTTYVKALVVTADGRRGEVWGVGRRRLRGGRRGRMADVALACEAALCQAEDMTLRTCGVTLVPDRAVLGLSGTTIHTTVVPVKTRRPQPDERVRAEEVHQLSERALRLAHAQAEQSGPMELVQAEPLSVAVDGRRVSDVTRFRGQDLELILFFAFIPQTQVQSLQRLRRRLELDSIATGIGSLALTMAQRQDGILIDLGGAATDLTLIRDGQLCATSHLPSGGGSLDRELARVLEITPARAELVKLSYSAGQLDEHTAQKVAAVCQREAIIWLESLQPILRRFGDEHPLPANIWLCGGGSQLDEVFCECQKYPWMQRFAFARYPQVQRLGTLDLPSVLDRTGGKLTVQDVPALALAQSFLLQLTTRPAANSLARLTCTL